MNIYFAGSIRGGRDDQELYKGIVEEFRKFGTVLTEHIGDPSLGAYGEARADKDICERDLAWIREADVVVAEVTTPSLGVGYEVGYAEAHAKPILCLYRAAGDRRLSAMIAGNANLETRSYTGIEDVKDILGSFFETLVV